MIGVDRLGAEERVVQARKRWQSAIEQQFREVGLTYPAQTLVLRCLKQEGRLDVYGAGSDGELKRIWSFPVLGRSGGPGPKRKEGDGQVPEGWYRVDRYNPRSSYHLSMGLDYPNAADRVHADPEKPGFDIFIHGGSATVGCLPIGDVAIEQLFLAALDASGTVWVLILPACFRDPSNAGLFAQHAGLAAFWQQLQRIDDALAKHRKVPKVEVARDGSYIVTE